VFTILPQYHRVVDNNSCKMHFVQLLTVFVVSLLVLAVEGQTVSRRPTIGTLAGSQLRRNSFLTARVTRKLRHLQRSIITNGGCNVKMCFALDGSGSISRAEYRLQQEFVQIIAAVASVDGAASFSAVQYGLRNVGISSLTSDIGDFITSVGTSELEKAPRTFVAAGLGFCIQEVRSSNDTDSTGNGGHVAIQGPSKIVLLGDGRTNFGISPIPIANLFDSLEDSSICAIGIGFPNVRALRDIVGGDIGNVFIVDSYVNLVRIVGDIISDACGI